MTADERLLNINSDRQHPAFPGTLYLVGTPIGHPDDLSIRAIETLRRADLIACEERKEAQRLLRRHGISSELFEINEHTERDAAEDVIAALRRGAIVALISDCGMPVFADPGGRVVRQALDAGLDVRAVPGPTSLTTALAVSGMDVTRFYFHGFPSPKRPERRVELRALKSHPSVLVFLDAPYRLTQLLADAVEAFGSRRRACVACDLTLETELVRRGTLASLHSFFLHHPGKREFVVMVEGYNKRGPQ
ncbi:MAG: rRNA (cytidine-2'-O-)-methyltransferase [Ignavibacteriae bacterium]|nr:rRNA (cytidine-2'-O-)-methyltransferase [Ignavibacteriota bacterium]